MSSIGSRLVSFGASAFAFSASFGAAAAATWWFLGGLGDTEGSAGMGNLDAAGAERQLQQLLGSLGDLENDAGGKGLPDPAAMLLGNGDAGSDGEDGEDGEDDEDDEDDEDWNAGASGNDDGDGGASAQDFGAACQFVRAGGVALTQAQQLRLYGLYKQATSGACESSRPSAFDFEGRAKWDSWKRCTDEGVAAADARKQYLGVVDELAPGWRGAGAQPAAKRGGGGGGRGGVGMRSVSTMADAQDARARAEGQGQGQGRGRGAAAQVSAASACLDLARDGNESKLSALLAGGGAGGANVNLCDEGGLSPLHYAADRGHAAVVRLLLQHGADIEARDEDGLTPLATAVMSEQLDATRALLDAGADPSTRDNDGETPMSNAPGGALKQLLLDAMMDDNEDGSGSDDDDDDGAAKRK